MTEEQIRQTQNDAITNKGFLPVNEELAETMTSPQEEVEANPRKFIIEECIPACQELWSKNIYTFMVSDHINEGVCWIEVSAAALSEENKEIYKQLVGEDVIKFSYHYGTLNFGVKAFGKTGQRRLLELARMFQMQDVPQNEAYISIEDFLVKYCDCYDEVPNPKYREMKPAWEIDLEPDQFIDYVQKYDEWLVSDESIQYLKKFNPAKVTKPIEKLVSEHGMIVDGERVYLSEFHYRKHQNYLHALATMQTSDEPSNGLKR